MCARRIMLLSVFLQTDRNLRKQIYLTASKIYFRFCINNLKVLYLLTLKFLISYLFWCFAERDNGASKMMAHDSIQPKIHRFNMRSSNPVVFRSMLHEDLLAEFILKQNWPGIEIKFVNTKIGDGLFATENILRGDSVCDYAGNLMTAEEMEKFLSTCTPEQQTLIGRYVQIWHATHPSNSFETCFLLQLSLGLYLQEKEIRHRCFETDKSHVVWTYC